MNNNRNNNMGNWIWLYPITMIPHLAEEFWGGEGFHNWLSRVGVEITASEWWLANGLFFLGLTIAIFLIQRYPALNWGLIALGVELFLNGLGHGLGAILTQVYSPGLFSGLLIWVPLGLFTLLYTRKKVSMKIFLLGLIAGLCVRAGVIGTVVLISKL